MNGQINFPNLHISLPHVGKTIELFGFPIAFYGIAIGIAIMVGILAACRKAKKSGQDPDTYVDLALWAVVLGIVGARIYYIIFQWEYYSQHPLDMFKLRQGGLAIYGGVIAATLTIAVFCRVKKLHVGEVLDTAFLGMVIGQSIGRWGNFFNREVFGGYTNNLLAMELPIRDVNNQADVTQEMLAHAIEGGGETWIRVHPTFLYESLWNFGLFLILWFYYPKKRFKGEVFLLYLAGYGLGRFWIEGIRTDQLMIAGTRIPVSQLIAGVTFVLSLLLIVILRGTHRSKRKK